MGSGKAQAHKQAVWWWHRDDEDVERFRRAGHAYCDCCGEEVPVNEGQLCRSLAADSPLTHMIQEGGGTVFSLSGPRVLICDTCFDQNAYRPWTPAHEAGLQLQLRLQEAELRRRAKWDAVAGTGAIGLLCLIGALLLKLICLLAGWQWMGWLGWWIGGIAAVTPVALIAVGLCGGRRRRGDSGVRGTAGSGLG